MGKFTTILVAALGLGLMATFIVQNNRDQIWTPEELVAFQNWTGQFNKSFGSPQEKLYRLSVFIKNLRYIQTENKLNKSYKLGLSHLSDMTEEEFSIKYLSRRGDVIPDSERVQPEASNADPLSVDWRTQGYITPVKDQGQCGSCWAFSSTGSLEAEYFANFKTLVSFSESQLVDCSTSFGNQGCNGGLQENAFDYYAKNGAITEAEYPYKAQDGQCKSAQFKYTANITGRTAIAKGQVALKQAAILRPLAVSVYAKPWLHYNSGVYDNTLQCPSSTLLLDHAVLLVGYGSNGGQDFWIVKNSWSTSWGEAGYIRLVRGTNGNGICGIALEALFPTGVTKPATL